MSPTIHSTGPVRGHHRLRFVLALVPLALALTASAVDASVHGGPVGAQDAGAVMHNGHDAPSDAVSAAMLATAGFQDVAVAEAAGYASSIDTLGCFQNPDLGGMGVHYIDEDLLDADVDVGHPEALVYELDAAGRIAGLVAHEYIVPIEAWTSTKPPRLFGMDFHRHPALPLWVLHAWLWKSNPAGMFADWNPAVRRCPVGVPVFGRDLPAD
jgi:hypothetical protein